MKTRELIELLQKEDPSGTHEVCIDNQPIWNVIKHPSYYDGRLMRYTPELTQDNFCIPDKIDFISEGTKVNIMYYSWKSALWDSDGKLQLGECVSDHTRKIFNEERQRILNFIKGK